MGKHLHDRAGEGGGVDHQDSEQHHAAVAYRGVGVDVFEVGLDAGRECSVDNRDAGQDKENPGEVIGSLRHEVHGHTEASVTTQLHKHTSMEHRHGGRGTGMTVGAPGMEGEHGAEDTEADKAHREEEILPAFGDTLCLLDVACDIDDVPGKGLSLGRGVVIDTDEAEHKEGGTAHQHQGELHRRIFLASGAPDSDEKIHRDEGYLVEHEHREEVDADEESVDTSGKQDEPHEEVARVVNLP